MQPHWPYSQKSKTLSRLSAASLDSILGWCKWRARKPSALVVDDDPEILPLVKAALSRYAISCDGVNDGAGAMEQLRTHSYDLVFLDLAMGGLAGFDVLLALKKDARFREIPVIVLTGNESDEALARSFGYGADDFVLKPFRPNELGMRAYRLLHPLTSQ
jgi:two-component system, OmpR family, lantibiotic biosynthesis response regulator NisR/SpaR